ncbi:hypothetical protein [Dictyobacter kobayashii]|uniref:hypothetical protein n=1 Tax=Dictyobacter kobayashii TaxID=2014872 RepID=UPI001FE36B42|nr:hypothetical protein [Dictyobacter kobayashii]
MSNPEVINNTAEKRYEIHVDDQVAILTYARQDSASSTCTQKFPRSLNTMDWVVN